MSDWKHFKLGFYHLFGRHATELPEKILPRKKLETEENGWTLWSFNRANLEVWHCVLSNTDPPSLFVFCGPWKKASDPGGRKRYCTCFRYVGPNEAWQPIPRSIKIPHPFKRAKHDASAFVVESVEYPIQSFSRPFVEWFSKTERIWKQDVRKRDGTLLRYFYPSRGEVLIRPGGVHPMREVSAVLKLKSPHYLAYVRVDDN